MRTRRAVAPQARGCSGARHTLTHTHTPYSHAPHRPHTPTPAHTHATCPYASHRSRTHTPASPTRTPQPPPHAHRTAPTRTLPARSRAPHRPPRRLRHGRRQRRLERRAEAPGPAARRAAAQHAQGVGGAQGAGAGGGAGGAVGARGAPCGLPLVWLGITPHLVRGAMKAQRSDGRLCQAGRGTGVSGAAAQAPALSPHAHPPRSSMWSPAPTEPLAARDLNATPVAAAG